MVMEKPREFQQNVYVCFIDCAKDFDCVDHNKLWKILKEMGVTDHLYLSPKKPACGQEATIRIAHGITDWFKIEKEV